MDLETVINITVFALLLCAVAAAMWFSAKAFIIKREKPGRKFWITIVTVLLIYLPSIGPITWARNHLPMGFGIVQVVLDGYSEPAWWLRRQFNGIDSVMSWYINLLDPEPDWFRNDPPRRDNPAAPQPNSEPDLI